MIDPKVSIHRPAKCFWCPRPALLSAQPDQPATCCGGPFCRDLEAAYRTLLAEAVERRAAEIRRRRMDAAKARAQRSFRQVETIRDSRFVDVPCAP